MIHWWILIAHSDGVCTFDFWYGFDSHAGPVEAIGTLAVDTGTNISNELAAVSIERYLVDAVEPLNGRCHRRGSPSGQRQDCDR